MFSLEQLIVTRLITNFEYFTGHKLYYYDHNTVPQNLVYLQKCHLLKRLDDRGISLFRPIFEQRNIILLYTVQIFSSTFQNT
jgi:hypothetical protein